MNIDNPLLTYTSWFSSIKTEWADVFATEFFHQICIFQDPDSPFNLLFNPDLFEYAIESEGEQSEKLLEFLDAIVEEGAHEAVQRTALALFVSTGFVVQAYDQIPPFDLLDYFKNSHISSLLKGDAERAKFFEAEIQAQVKNRIVRKEIKASWDKFIIEDFNMETIYAYMMNGITGRE